MVALYRRSATAHSRTSPSRKFVSIPACRAVALQRRVHSWLRLLDYISHIERWWTVAVNLLHHTAFDSTNFFRCLLRTNIIFADVKHDVSNKLERVIQHQSFHFPVVTAAPIFS